MSLALTAIGKDPRQVGGTDLLAPLGDYRKVVRQGANGAAWALIALDAGGYAVPEAPGAAVQATRQLYVDFLLESQLPEGGWSLGTTADPDLTGMALTALAPYRDQAAVMQAAEKALERMSDLQGESGGFATAESAAQMLVALVAWDISLEDGRFVKNGRTLLDGLLADYLPGRGFHHQRADGSGGSRPDRAVSLCDQQPPGEECPGAGGGRRRGGAAGKGQLRPGHVPGGLRYPTR